MTLIIGPGMWPDVSKDDYLADPCEQPSLSSSIAGLLVSSCPAKAWAAHPRGGGVRSDPTAAMVRGSIIDSLLLGGDAEIVESPYDEYRTNEAKAWKAAAFARGQIPVKAKEFAEHVKNAAGIQASLRREGIELDGEHQVTLVWQVGSVFCRARLDHWKPKSATIYDLKVVEDASPESVQRKMVDYGYDIQWAAYTSAIETLVPELEGRVEMQFLFAEPEPPYLVNVAPVDGTMKTLGRWKWDRAVKEWGEGLATGKWRGYVSAPVSAPQYALAKMDAAMIGNGSQGVTF